MDLAVFSQAVLPILATLGGGLAFLINRADKRRERNEALLIAHLEKQVAQLEKEQEELRDQHRAEIRKKNKEIRHLRKQVSACHSDGGKWREQMAAAGIKPEPATWTVIPEEPDDDD